MTETPQPPPESSPPSASPSRAARLRAALARAGRMGRIAGPLQAYFRALFSRDASVAHRLGLLAKGAGVAVAGLAAWLVVYTLLLIPFTPGIADLQKAKLEHPTVLLSADGKELAAYRRMNREWVKLTEIAPSAVDALIATEDRRFYRHHGIDFRRTAGALYYTLQGDQQGGSTLTQQLARNLYPDQIGRAPTLTRKLKEMITALKIEFSYTKDEILETYLNTVPFLYNAYGIEMAARTYFGKTAQELNVLESATLVGMLKGTSYYNPVLNPDRALERRNLVLAQMVDQGKLPAARYESLRTRPLRLDFERQGLETGPAPHFAEYVRRWLVAWADRNGYNIHADGLVVHSTLDSRLQRIANQAVARQMEGLQAIADVEWGLRSERLLSTSTGAYRATRRRIAPFAYFWDSRSRLIDDFVRETPDYKKLRDGGADDKAALATLKGRKEFLAALRAEKTRLQSGFVAVDPQTGAIKAWVGSRDFALDQYDHVVYARRQPGSTFKPFVYGAALEQGMRPGREFVDTAVEIKLPGGEIWRPEDAGGASGRPMSIKEGLIYSKNTITAQVMQEVGPRSVSRLAIAMGVRDSRLEEVPSLALGTSPVTLLEMVAAYGTIANGGEYLAPLFVTHITDKDGNLLARFGTTPQRAVSQPTTVELIDMMRGAVDRGTGRSVRDAFGIRADVAGKTGTTQNYTDGWFILMHPQLVAGAWVGFNDSRITMRSGYWGQGGHNALLLVGDFFREALRTRAVDSRAAFPRPPEENIIETTVDRVYRWFEEMTGHRPKVEEGGGANAPPPPPPREIPPRRDDEIPAETRRGTEKDRRAAEGVVDRVTRDVTSLWGKMTGIFTGENRRQEEARRQAQRAREAEQRRWAEEERRREELLRLEAQDRLRQEEQRKAAAEEWRRNEEELLTRDEEALRRTSPPQSP